MKTADIVIKDKCIVLGIFGTETFAHFLRLNNVLSFHEFPGAWINSIIDRVEWACEEANQIIFILDEVHFPINPSKSYTCSELELVCKSDKFFNKTIFVKGENVVEFDKNLVL